MSGIPTIKTPRGLPKGITFIDDLPFYTTKYEEQRGQEITADLLKRAKGESIVLEPDSLVAAEVKHPLVVDSLPEEFQIRASPQHPQFDEASDADKIGEVSNNTRRLMNWDRSSATKKAKNRKANKAARKQRKK